MSAEQLKQRDAMQRLTDFLNEVGMLRHTPRSGYKFLGSGQETVAEHSHRTAVIGYVLAKRERTRPARSCFASSMTCRKPVQGTSIT